MPPVEDCFRFDVAVLWPRVGTDDRGMPVLGSPVQVLCGWTDSKALGRSSEADAGAVVAMVDLDRPAEKGSAMWKGTLAQYVAAVAAGTLRDVMVVDEYGETADVKGRDVAMGATLTRAGDSPVVVG